MEGCPLALPSGDERLPCRERLRRKIRQLHPGQRRGRHRDGEERIRRPALGSQGIAAVEFAALARIEQLEPQAHGIDHMRKPPEVAQRLVGTIETAPFARVAVLQEKRADVGQAEVTWTQRGGAIQVKDHVRVGLREHLVEELPVPLHPDGRRDGEGVNLEVAHAELAPECEEAIGVALPIPEVVGGIRSEPETEAEPLCLRGIRQRLQPLREALRVRLPEAGIGVPEVAPRLRDSGQERLAGVGGAPTLPAVVDLDDVHANARAGVDLLQKKILADARVTVARAPGV